MRRICGAFLMVVLLNVSVSYGAVSEDMSVYLRKDVFDAKMDAFMSEIRLMNEQLRGEIRALNAKIDGVESSLSEKIDGVKTSLNAKIDGVESSLNTRIDGVESSLNAKINGVESSLSAKIDGVDAKLSGRIDGLDARMSDLRNGLYLGLVLFGTVIALFGVVIGLPFFNKWREERQKEKEEQRRPSFTLDDVRRLIEENNAELRRSLQV